MIETILTASNIMFAIGLLGVVFSVYHYFKEPQIKFDKSESLLSLKLGELQEDLINLRDNHVHSLQEKLEETNKCLAAITVEVAKLGTIIDERIPRPKRK